MTDQQLTMEGEDMPRNEHFKKAQAFAELSEQMLPKITEPGAKAQTLALLALVHAVLETGYDIDGVRGAIQDRGL
ncbi:hypothetical protein AB0D46_35230 [Streptomyces sp. NPDC048383]|uniref:hypothetical protein n=1 Tax=Streptomyces sp. NPDC048383 TaxID=3155386 RepID=UPI00341A89B9